MTTDKTRPELVAAELARLGDDYRARLPAELDGLEALASGLRGAAADRVRLEELHQALHKLAGSGGTFGLATLGTQAHALEQRIQAWLAGELEGVDLQARHRLAADLAALRDALGDARDAPAPPVPLGDQPAEPRQAALVWLIEDDKALGQELRQQLESFGYDTRVFERIADAEAAAQTRRPDMLIMDVLFPQEGENATEVLGLRPTLHAMGCPLLFISSDNQFPSRARASRLGAQGYFVKPLDVPSLVNRMAHIFDRRRAPPARVLIVEDDVALAAHYKLTLLAAGMQAEVLHQPQANVESTATLRPELVLMDMHMPDYSGPELAGVIRQYERWASLPIVYLSAETDLDMQIEAMGRGADDFLTKPISDAHLVAAVRARIERARQLDAQITRDSLTGLLKHSSIKETLEIEVVRARRSGAPVTVAMLDIDHFKTVNDTYGHATGDLVISSVAMLLRQRLRQSDFVGRYGGEEFVAVLPECDAASAQRLLEDIRQRFAAVSFSHGGKTFTCALSAGLATSVHFPRASGAALLVVADEALYLAKRSGRNQVRCAAPGQAATGSPA